MTLQQLEDLGAVVAKLTKDGWELPLWWYLLQESIVERGENERKQPQV